MYLFWQLAICHKVAIKNIAFVMSQDKETSEEKAVPLFSQIQMKS